MFNEGVSLPADVDVATMAGWVRALEVVGPAMLKTGGVTLTAFLAGENVRLETELLVCSDAEAETLLQVAEEGAPRIFRQVHIHKGWADPSRFIARHPTPNVLRRFRTQRRGEQGDDGGGDSGDGGGAAAGPAPGFAGDADQGPLLYIPPQHLEKSARPTLNTTSFLHQDTDPVRIVHALAFARWLRSPKYFVVALDDAVDYLLHDAGSDSDETVRRNSATGPKGARSLRRHFARADVVCMNLTRRFFRQWRHDGSLRAINIFSDASPVTGKELQGMLIDVTFSDGKEPMRLVLPGSTLAYGHTSTMDKGAALLWAIWLIAGPSLEDLTFFCDHVRSLTTDFGVEMHLLELPDIKEALLAWAAGCPLPRVRMLVKPDQRLFRKALRIAGWSHTMGNIMKATAEQFPQWPSHLGKMRSMCKVLKNNSYREHIRRRLDWTEEEGKTLKHFTATFAKWRYETVFEVLRQLLDYRQISARLPRELFARAQDQEEINTFFHACKDLPFWRWASASFGKIFSALEYLRRWGMVCECPEHIEQRKTRKFKFIKCLRI